jgi:hypothetical protein
MSITMGQLASRYAQASSKVTPEASKNIKALSQVGVGLVKKAIQEVHAVDTSTMLNSTTAESAGPNTYLVGPTVQYASFVALGTSRRAARPFHTMAAAKLSAQAGDFGLNADDLGI